MEIQGGLQRSIHPPQSQGREAGDGAGWCSLRHQQGEVPGEAMIGIGKEKPVVEDGSREEAEEGRVLQEERLAVGSRSKCTLVWQAGGRVQ